jgi:hypothetical protein
VQVSICPGLIPYARALKAFYSLPQMLGAVPYGLRAGGLHVCERRGRVVRLNSESEFHKRNPVGPRVEEIPQIGC